MNNKNTDGKLSGKVALVTGASKGIGASIAKHLAAEGAAVVVNYNSGKSDADRVVTEITREGGKAIAVQANLSQKAEIDRMFAETRKALGRLDILVNNAGTYEFTPLEKVTEEHFHKLFNLNVLGLILASQKAAEYFDSAGGCIINIGSGAGINPVPGGSVYSATKAAVDAITKSLSKELGARKIRVNSLNPGMVETPGAAPVLGTDFHKRMVAETPLGRIAKPEDIGKVAAFLASEDAGWISGETLLVAGGWR
jgi:3-oxoacyl-[acyl-carrier protein] reductase